MFHHPVVIWHVSVVPSIFQTPGSPLGISHPKLSTHLDYRHWHRVATSMLQISYHLFIYQYLPVDILHRAIVFSSIYHVLFHWFFLHIFVRHVILTDIFMRRKWFHYAQQFYVLRVPHILSSRHLFFTSEILLGEIKIT